MDKERWFLINPGLETKPDEYLVSDTGHIKNARTGLIMDDYIYHSSNGYDFVLLTMMDDSVQYVAVDVIVMVSCRSKLPFNALIIPFHMNGNTRDNRLENLSPGEDIELWRPIVHNVIKPGLYEVSNHGRTRNVVTGHVTTSSIKNCYPKSKFYTKFDTRAGFDIHRLVATAFSPNHDDEHDIVNHIDNVKWNNYWRNLEWVSYSENNRHASTLIDKKISNDTLDMIRDMLMTYGSTRETYNMLDHQKYWYITEEIIDTIKSCSGYIRSNKFTLAELYQLKSNTYRCRGCFTDDDINHFCEILAKYDLDVDKAYHHLKDEEYFISRAAIYDLKIKRHHKNIADKYF